MPKNVRDLGKLIVAKGFKKLPKVQKSPDLVTLMVIRISSYWHTQKLAGCARKSLLIVGDVLQDFKAFVSIHAYLWKQFKFICLIR